MSPMIQIGSPALEKLAIAALAETLEPKAIRKQRQQQEAIEKLSSLASFVKDLPEEERDKFYNKFFRAYGIYEPPLFRRIFGAGPEPVLPLPKGSRVEEKSVGGPLGLGRTTQTQYILPPMEPLRIEPPPIISPAQKKELIESARAAGMSDDEIRELLFTIKAGKLSPTTAGKEIDQWRLARASRWIREHMDAYGVDEKTAEAALIAQNPALGYFYQREKAKGEAEQEERQSKIDWRREQLRLREEAQEAKKKAQELDRQLREQMHRDRIEIEKRKMEMQKQNKEAASKANTVEKVWSAMLRAYAIYSSNIDRHNRLELDRERQAFMSGVPYIRNEIRLKSFEEWQFDEGLPFIQRMEELKEKEGAGAPSPPPPIRQPGHETKPLEAPKLRERGPASQQERRAIVDEIKQSLIKK